MISSALRGPTGRAAGDPAGILGTGESGSRLIPAGGPNKIFSGRAFHSSSGSANFATDWLKLSRTPASVEITIAANSLKIASLKILIVKNLASTNFVRR